MMNIADELVVAAAERYLAQLDEKLFLKIFAPQPTKKKPEEGAVSIALHDAADIHDAPERAVLAVLAVALVMAEHALNCEHPHRLRRDVQVGGRRACGTRRRRGARRPQRRAGPATTSPALRVRRRRRPRTVQRTGLLRAAILTLKWRAHGPVDERVHAHFAPGLS